MYLTRRPARPFCPLCRRAAKALVDAVELNAAFVGRARDQVDFSPRDLGRVGSFLSREAAEGAAPLAQYNAVVQVRCAALAWRSRTPLVRGKGGEGRGRREEGGGRREEGGGRREEGGGRREEGGGRSKEAGGRREEGGGRAKQKA